MDAPQICQSFMAEIGLMQQSTNNFTLLTDNMEGKLDDLAD
jgi:hypothetical protein